jgi:hypothetical protein
MSSLYMETIGDVLKLLESLDLSFIFSIRNADLTVYLVHCCLEKVPIHSNHVNHDVGGKVRVDIFPDFEW